MTSDPLKEFVESIVDASGPYRYLDGTQIVADAYRVLKAHAGEHAMPDGRPIFGEGSPHKISEHLEALCAADSPAPDGIGSPTRYTDGSYSREYEEQAAPAGQVDEKKRGALRQYEYLVAAKDFNNPDEVRERVRALDRLAGETIREALNEPMSRPTPDHAALLIEALERLAKLGNGRLPGNSIGNQIAQDALAAYHQAMAREE